MGCEQVEAVEEALHRSATSLQPGVGQGASTPARLIHRRLAELDALARALAKKRPGAAASLREGLDETLTVNRLGVTGSLLKTCDSTNPVESMIEIVRDHALRVKHWTSGEMALRWAAAGMTAAESQFRRVKGYRQLPDLARALERQVGYQPTEHDIPAEITA